jgi:NADPH2:quinone reductase
MNTVIRFHRYGDASVLEIENEALGAPGPGQVRLAQHAIGVNFIDTLFRQGLFAVPLPAVAGVEGAGIVEAVGVGVNGLAVGDRVAYFLAPGSYAQRRLVEADALVKVSDDIPLEEVAAFLTKGLTAWAGLHGYHQLGAGQTVLVQGASSGVGQFLGRWARTLGATVIGTAGSQAKQAALLGDIDHVLPSDAPDLAQRVRALVPGGVDVVYEFVGRATFAATAASVRDGGTIVNIGAASGAPEIDADELARRGVRLTGGPMAPHVQASQGRAITEVFEAYRSGLLRTGNVTRYRLTQARQAHEDIASRLKAGAIVLLP